MWFSDLHLLTHCPGFVQRCGLRMNADASTLTHNRYSVRPSTHVNQLSTIETRRLTAAPRNAALLARI